MLRQPRLYRFLPLILCLFLTMPAITPAIAQTEAEINGDVNPIVLSLTEDETLEAGRSWTDPDGFHVREQVTAWTVNGDIAGTAEAVSDVDWFGPCAPDASACDGALEISSSVELRSDDRRWSGTLAVTLPPDARPQTHGILIGRHGTNDQVIVIDEIAEIDEDTFELSGRMVTLTGPIGGVHLAHSACLTGETTADGGFIGTQGLIDDDGPVRIMRYTTGGEQPTGVYGEVRQLGHKGNLRGVFTARMHGRHAHGSFVLAGESGAYDGLLGYGRATSTLSEGPRCRSGMQVTSTWIGQARYLTNPASFLAPRVYFASPTDGAVVGTPVVLEIGAANVEIEPAGMARDGAGYLTVIVDAPCIGPGEPVPVDDDHHHLTGGEMSVELGLFSGPHRLCLQLTDGAGIAQPATDVIMIRVSSSAGDEPGGVLSQQEAAN